VDDVGTRYRAVPVAVLGASGFIGRWVAQALVAGGARVALIVRDRARATPVFRRLGIAGHVEEVDLRAPDTVHALFRVIRPAITFNLVAYGTDPSHEDGTEAELVNGRLVGWITEAVATWRSAGWPGSALVHAGTALEYGQIGGDLAESSEPRPTTTYGRSKLAGTRALASCATRHALPAMVARLFTVYGPGERPGRLLPSLIEATRHGRALPLTAGTQRRDFTYVEDAAEGLLRLGAAPCRPGEAVNLATGALWSIREFAELAADILDIEREKLEFGKLPAGTWDTQHAAVNVERLRTLTGWVPPTGPAEGIRRTRELSRHRS
jgi:UDP-glucose 4-epimerase